MMADRTALRVAVLAAAACALSGCSGGGSTAVTPATIPPPFEYMFGNGFGADFTAAANSTPATLSASGIIPLSLTASPIPFPTGTTGTN